MPALRLLLFVLIVSLVALPASSLPFAQTPEPVCGDLITRAVETVGTACDGITRNQACYGNNLIETELLPDHDYVFAASGDLVDLSSLLRISTTPYDAATDQWGIAVVKAQADLPDALPGQNVTFLLFGDATLENPTPDMRIVTVETSFTEEVICEEAPSGVLIQSPRGTQVEMTLNGANVILGSTVYVTAISDELLTLATLDGTAVVTAFDEVRVVMEGTQITLPLDEALQVIGEPSLTEPINPALVQYLPITLLDEEVILPEVTDEPSALTPVPVATECVRRADWTFRYTIQSGDTLSSIAGRAGLNTFSLQSGNCITDPNIIRVGEVLNVPVAVPTRIPPTIVRPTTPPALVSFYADSTTLNAGECTTIHWSVAGETTYIYSGYEQSLPAQGSSTYCPTTTSTVSLFVGRPDDTTESYSITITVIDVCGDQICGSTEDAATCPGDCGLSGS